MQNIAIPEAFVADDFIKAILQSYGAMQLIICYKDCLSSGGIRV